MTGLENRDCTQDLVGLGSKTSKMSTVHGCPLFDATTFSRSSKNLSILGTALKKL